MRVSVSSLDRWQWEVPSSRGGASYLVAWRPDGSWSCTCRGFSYSARPDGLCRHVDLVREAQAVPLSLADLLDRAA